MVFQLVVSALLLLLLLLASQVIPLLGGSTRRPGGGRTPGSPDERLGWTLRDAARTFVLFAPYVLLMYLQGKPDLLPQYLAWAVIAVAVVQGAAQVTGRVSAARLLGAANALILILLWVRELPLLQSPPA